MRERNAARDLALLRKVALNFARADTTLRASLSGERKYAGWDDTFMAALIAGRSRASPLPLSRGRRARPPAARAYCCGAVPFCGAPFAGCFRCAFACCCFSFLFDW